MGSFSEALVHAERAHELAPTAPEILDTLGMVHLQSGNHDEAVEKLGRAAILSPESGGIRLNYSRALYKSGDAHRARLELKDMLSTIESFPERDAAEALLAKLGPAETE